MTWLALEKALENAVWYSAVFNLAAHRLHQARLLKNDEQKTNEEKENEENARKYALLLSYACVFQVDRDLRGATSPLPKELVALDATLFKEPPGLETPKPPPEAGQVRVPARQQLRPDEERDDPAKTRRILLDFIKDTVESSALVLLAGALVSVSPATELSLGLGATKPNFDRRKILEQLRLAALSQGWPNPVPLARAVANEHELAARAHYNLACFFAQVGERLADAEAGDDALTAVREGRKHFQNAFGGPDRVELVRWATKDPTITPILKGWEEGEDRWEEGWDILREITGEADLLEELVAIGGYAPALEGAGIRTESALRARTATDEARKALAQELNISEELVSRWAGLACLLGLPGIEPPEANLLDAAGVSDLAALRTQDADELHKRLEEMNTARRLVDDVPSVPTLTEWIAQAAGRPS